VSLRLEGVSYRYAGAASPAVDGLDLLVPAGRVVGLVGPNEAGKSTACLLASGLAPGTVGGRLEGRVTVDGLDTATARPHELAQRCGILFQDPATQLSGTAATVWEEVAFGPRNLSLALDDVIDRVEEALATLGIADLAHRDPAGLSGGEGQLVALAAVLALRPACLVLDEPTSQLDPHGTRVVGDALARVAHGAGTAVLIVEHKAGLLARLADEVAVIEHGRITVQGPAADVLARADLVDRGVEPAPATRIRLVLAAAGVAVPADLEALLEATAT
jgi:energy-coupling factor transporter ATP-binding protein EcfA2